MNDEVYYTYIFVRQDISYEQQAVQAAHATFQLGVKLKNYKYRDGFPHILSPDPKETHFTLVGVRDLDGLNGVREILDKFEMQYEVFYEPDLNEGEYTAIAVAPVYASERGPLMAFNLLKMGR